MRESWKSTTFGESITSEKTSFSACHALLWSGTFLALLFLSYLVCQATLMRADEVSHSGPRLSRDELRSMMFSVVNGSNDFDDLVNNESEDDRHLGELQLLDQDYRVLWSKELNRRSLRNFNEFVPEVEATFVGNDNERSDGKQMSVRRIREAQEQAQRVKKYVVSSIQRAHYVNCQRFRPIRQMRYLFSPSIHALQECYRNGITLKELEHGAKRAENEGLRYDLVNLYIPCSVVFDPGYLVELTEELRDDFEDCSWSGSLDKEQRTEIERRFAVALATRARPSPLVDRRSFVECSHLEVQQFEDFQASPSYEALRRCRRHGVTAAELERGMSRPARRSTRLREISQLFLPCNDVFGSRFEFITGHLRDDYRWCKRLGAVSDKAQQRIEEKFHESLDSEEKTTTTTTTEKPDATAFANCKRYEITYPERVVCIEY